MPDSSCPAGEMTKRNQKVVVHVTDIGGVCEMTLKVLVRSLDLNLLLIWISKFCSQLIYFQITHMPRQSHFWAYLGQSVSVMRSDQSCSVDCASLSASSWRGHAVTERAEEPVERGVADV
jgi:hypothetical protein